jgi:serine/threonine protein kinase/osmotically-inducible protein OsmY
MRRCPACRRMYENRVEICQVDGRPLDELNGDPIVGRTISRRYRVTRKLGGGDLGAVYQAEELATGNTVALKILLEELDWDPEYVKQCRWEARFASASNPSNIVRVYDVDRSDQGRVFIVMEYLEGESLANVIRRDGPFEMTRALRLAGEIAQALATATKSGVTHRNLKPQNVMLVGPNERVKVTDFGIARLRETVSDGRLGIGEYAAPEQLKSGEVTDRTDIYSLGAVLYTMLTGSSPSSSARASGAGEGDLGDAPAPVRKLRPEVPVALEQFVMRAMERKPELRQSGIWEFIDGLRELADAVITGKMTASPSVAPPPARPAEPQPPVAAPARKESAEPASVESKSVAPESVEPESAEPESRPAPPVNRLRYADLLGARRGSPMPVVTGLDHRWRHTDVPKSSRLDSWKLTARALPVRWRAHVEGWRRPPGLRSRLDSGRLVVTGYVNRWLYPGRRASLAKRPSTDPESQQSAPGTRWLDAELWRLRLASSRLGLAGFVTRWRQAPAWQSSLGGWRRVRSGLGALPRDIAVLSSHPGGRLALIGAVGLAVVGVTVWAVMSWSGGGSRGSSRVPSAPTVTLTEREAVVAPQVPEVREPDIVPPVAAPVTPERRRVEAPRIESDRGRQADVAAARRAERRQAEIEAARQTEEARRLAEAEASRRAEEERRQTEVEAARRAEEEQRRQAEIEATRRAEEERRRQVESEATARRQAEPEAARTRAQAAPLVQTARPAEAPPARPVMPALSAAEVSRIQTQAEQKLLGRGLLRVSGSDRWGVSVEVGPTGEATLSGTLRDMTLYGEAIRLVREVPGVHDVKATGMRVSDIGAVSPAQSDAAGIRSEIQARLRSRGLLRESATDRWGVTVEVGAGGEVTLGGVVRDVGLQGEAIRLVQGVPGVRQVKQDIRVMEGAGRLGSPLSP